jgi:hypothetical protein
MENLYRIEEYFTNGWELANPKLVKLSKEECKRQLEVLINQGSNPSYLRAVPDNEVSS